MGATFNRLKNWIAEVLNYADLNAEIDNILTNFTPAGMDDYSTNVAQMKLQTTPGGLATESLAQSLAAEIERLRYVIARALGTTYWYEAAPISISEIFTALGNEVDDNRIVSGRARAGSSMLIALVPHGTLARVTLKGATTPFIYYVAGTRYTISTDVNLTLSLAPASNNTALTNLGTSPVFNVTNHKQLKYTGEFDSAMHFDAAGSNVLARNGMMSAFKVNNGAADEFFVGTPVFKNGSSTVGKLLGCRRGFFFDSSDAPVPRVAVDDNRTLTVLKIAFIFAKTDGTLAVSYNPLTVSGVAPTSPASGDYWFDSANQIWMTYSGSGWIDSTSTFVGWAACDSSGCIVARTVNAYANSTDLNTIRTRRASLAQVTSTEEGQRVNVNGNLIRYFSARPLWDMTVHLDSGVTEAALTTYFMYLTEAGTPVISDIAPYDRPDMQGYYHPHQNWRCVAQAHNSSGSDLVHTLDYQKDSRAYAVTNSVSANAATIILHATPMRYWEGHSEGDTDYNEYPNPSGAVSAYDAQESVRVPFGMVIIIPSSATIGQAAGPAVNEGKIYIYLFKISGFCDIAIASFQVNHEPFLSGSSIVVAIGAGSTSTTLYGNTTAPVNTSPRLIPVATLTPNSPIAGTWDTAFGVSLAPFGFRGMPTAGASGFTVGGAAFISSNAIALSADTSGDWQAMTNNSVVLPAGMYRVDPYLHFVGSVATNLSAKIKIADANGDGSNVEPAYTDFAGTLGNDAETKSLDPDVTGTKTVIFHPIFLRVSTARTIFMNAAVTFSTADAATVACRAFITRWGK